jgi:hypothetical protein
MPSKEGVGTASLRKRKPLKTLKTATDILGFLWRAEPSRPVVGKSTAYQYLTVYTLFQSVFGVAAAFRNPLKTLKTVDKILGDAI